MLKVKPILLVMTATVTPPAGVPNLKRIDPTLRMGDYSSALNHYLKLPTEVVDRIVFLENSNDKLTDIRELVDQDRSGKDVEVISFSGLDYHPSYGRAYGEFKMLDHGFQVSRLLTQMDDDDCFWKVTGRLRIHNLADIATSVPSKYDLLIDFLTRPTPMVDLRLYSCTRAGYGRLLEGRYPEFREDRLGSSVEYYLYSTWLNRANELGIVQRHKRQPKISGMGGQHNEDYLAGFNGTAKYLIRSVARRIAPGFWI